MLDRDLAAAYRRTRYLAWTADGAAIAVRIGEVSAPLDALLTAREVASAVFITAWNPHSHRLDEAENRRRHAALAAEVAAAGLAALPHRGEAEDGSWAEEGLLVLGLDRRHALDLARRHQQNAVVWYTTGEPAILLAAGQAGGEGRE